MAGDCWGRGQGCLVETSQLLSFPRISVTVGRAPLRWPGSCRLSWQPWPSRRDAVLLSLFPLSFFSSFSFRAHVLSAHLRLSLSSFLFLPFSMSSLALEILPEILLIFTLSLALSASWVLLRISRAREARLRRWWLWEREYRLGGYRPRRFEDGTRPVQRRPRRR